MKHSNLTKYLLGAALLAGSVFAVGSQKKESTADMQKRSNEMQQEIKRTRQEISENERQVRATVAELNTVRSRIDENKTTIAEASKTIEELNERIDDLTARIDAGQEKLKQMRATYLKSIKKMRAARVQNSELAFLFSSETFSQAMRRLRYLREFAGWRSRQSGKILDQIDVLEAQKEDLNKAYSEKKQTLNTQHQAQAQLQQQEVKQQQLVTELNKHGAELRGYLARKQQEANDLKNRISAIIAEEQRKAEEQRLAAERRKAEEARIAEQKRQAEEKRIAEEKRKAEEKRIADEKRKAEQAAADRAAAEKKSEAQKKADAKKAAEEKKKADAKRVAEQRKIAEENKKKAEAAKKENAKKEAEKKEAEKRAAATKKEEPKKETQKSTPAQSNASFESRKGSLPRPVDGTFRIVSPFGKHELPELPGVIYDNPGIDVVVASGAAAKAIAQGTVTGVYSVSGYGTVVIINHGNHYSVYGNLSSVAVKQGDSVSQGQRVGSVGTDPDDSSRSLLHFEVWKGREKLNPMDWIR